MSLRTMHRCPVCQEWYFIAPHTEDYVHQCIKADKTRLTEDGRNFPGRIAGRVTMNIENDEFPMSGQNQLYPPNMKKEKSEIQDSLLTEINVDTYIEFG